MMRAGIARALVATSLFFCTPLHAQADAAAAIAVGIVGWPADPSDALHAMGSDMEACLVARMREVAPEIVVTRQRTIRDALFPLLEPATQPATEEAFAALLAREEVRGRLVQRGLHYLIAFSGGTLKDKPGGGILCGGGFGAGGCLGFSWQGETTALDAALWSLDAGVRIRHEDAKVEGTFVMPAFILPVPIPARTKAQACHELGSKIARAIRQTAAEHAADR
jgi:hypothetical protein